MIVWVTHVKVGRSQAFILRNRDGPCDRLGFFYHGITDLTHLLRSTNQYTQWYLRILLQLCAYLFLQ